MSFDSGSFDGCTFGLSLVMNCHCLRVEFLLCVFWVCTSYLTVLNLSARVSGFIFGFKFSWINVHHQSLCQWQLQALLCVWSYGQFLSQLRSSRSWDCLAATVNECFQLSSGHSVLWSLHLLCAVHSWALCGCLSTSLWVHFQGFLSRTSGFALLFYAYWAVHVVCDKGPSGC